MKNDNGITAIEYKYEWEDHLYQLYGSFKRRNDLNEWIYFFRRPELANPEKSGMIAEQVLRYIVTYGHIAQKVVQSIENVFHYMENRKKYEEILGYGAMEYYHRYYLSSEEFPPYELFEEYDPEKDYDGFIYTFCEIYYNLDAGEQENYKQALEKLRGYDIRHPYIALLDSAYYDACGQWQEAVNCFDSMEAGYHKYMHMGFMLLGRKVYDIAENCFAKAVTYRKTNLDTGLVTAYIICKWENGKQIEALTMANEFAENGYEHVIVPIKHRLLYDLSVMLSEKSKERQLNEAEMLIIKEFCMSIEDYESVINLGEMSWNQGFENGSWTVDMAEAYFETGQFEQAQNIVDMVYDGRKAVSREEQIKLRAIKARLLFQSGRIKDAYEIMEDLCVKKQSTMRQQLILADMYMTTGRTEAAMDILSRLRFHSPDNFIYSYKLAQCLMECGDNEGAHYLFNIVYNKNPEFQKTAYYLVQASIDSGELVDAEQELEKAEEYLSPHYAEYLQGQILEMKEKYEKAKDTYQEMILSYDAEPYEKSLLYDVYLRYFCMREETGGRMKPMLSELKSTMNKIPEAAKVWLYFGEVHEKAELEDGAAEKCYRNALKAEPFNKEAMQKLASLYIDDGRWRDVWELSEKLIIYADLTDAYAMRAQSGLELGKTEQCRRDLEIFEQRGGEKYLINILRGQLAMRNEEYDKAIELFELAMDNRRVSDTDCYDILSVCMFKQGNTDEAAALLDTVCESSGNHVHHFLLYDMYMYLGDFKAAGNTLQRYKSLCGVGALDDTYSFLYAEFLMNSGKGLVAKKIAESVASPDGERLCGIIELMYRQKGKAIRIFKKLIRKQSEVIDNYSWLSLALYLKGLNAEAQEYAKQGLQIFYDKYGSWEDVRRPDLICQYAFLQTMCGNMEKAKEAFDRALTVPTCQDRICRECYEAHYGMGIYYSCNGNMKNSGIEFEKSLRIKSANAVCRKMSKIMTR